MHATDVILSAFRANGLLLQSGDRLARTAGLTAARWQVLGAIALAGRALTAPQIARRMGLSRQTVHVTLAHLTSGKLVELVPNADHRRSNLVRLTPAGEAAFRAIDRRQIAWVNRLAAGLSEADLKTTRRVLDQLSVRLEHELQGDDKPTPRRNRDER